MRPVVQSPTPTTGFPVYATPATSLSEIPIFVGKMTLNEGNNSGFTQQYAVSWTSDDLRITTDGKVSGTFQVTCNGPMAVYAQFKDVLFFQVDGNYIHPRFGDFLHQPLSAVVPVISEASDERSAKFQVETTFKVPPLINDIDGGMPLLSLDVTLTWVRVTKSEQQLFVQVFAGDANRYPNKPQIGFDQEPQTLTARFGYYAVLPESAIKGGRALQPEGEFEYASWLRENIKW
ncbi:MAG: hypothetical protein RBT75_06505 [Anaerolineae bacterium]|nr:hypothetical protein [Anaerolineae bacterium]